MSTAARSLPAAPGLWATFVPAAAAPPADGQVLALVQCGVTPPAPSPVLQVPTPFTQLQGEPLVECWSAGGPVSRGRENDVEYAVSGDVLFGWTTAEAGARGALEEATRVVYARLFALAEGAGRPHLLRIWNAVPRINDEEAGLARYMLFCRGRSLAFEEHYGAEFPARLPAGTGVGCDGDALVVHFIACRARPAHRENPRQISAWRYPPRYGPRSPTFARATLAPQSVGGALFVAGTSSIVGHESVHAGDPESQVDETVRNIASLLGDGRGDGGIGRSLERLGAAKVFVRRPEQAAAIHARLAKWLDPRTTLLFLRADICRAELLVEIEGLARPA